MRLKTNRINSKLKQRNFMRDSSVKMRLTDDERRTYYVSDDWNGNDVIADDEDDAAEQYVADGYWGDEEKTQRFDLSVKPKYERDAYLSHVTRNGRKMAFRVNNYHVNENSGDHYSIQKDPDISQYMLLNVDLYEDGGRVYLDPFEQKKIIKRRSHSSSGQKYEETEIVQWDKWGNDPFESAFASIIVASENMNGERYDENAIEGLRVTYDRRPYRMFSVLGKFSEDLIYQTVDDADQLLREIKEKKLSKEGEQILSDMVAHFAKAFATTLQSWDENGIGFTMGVTSWANSFDLTFTKR